MTLRELQDRAYQQSTAKGFHDHPEDKTAADAARYFHVSGASLAPYGDAIVSLLEEVRALRLERKLLLVIGEICEAHEELRAGHQPTEVYQNEGSSKPEGSPSRLPMRSSGLATSAAGRALTWRRAWPRRWTTTSAGRTSTGRCSDDWHRYRHRRRA